MTSLDLVGQLYIDGVWTTYPGLSADGWQVQIGPDVETGYRPNKIAFTFNNDGLDLDPDRASSTLYGKIGLNTKTRVRLNSLTLTQAEASSWQPERSPDHVSGANRGRAATLLQAEGLIHRLDKWSDPIDSAMTHQIKSYGDDLLGYWPCEDASGSLQLNQAAPRGSAGTWSGTVRLAAGDGPGGAGPVAELGSDATIRGTFGRTTLTGYQVCFSATLDAAPSAATYDPIFGWRDTFGRLWWINISNANLQVECMDDTGTLVVSHAVSYGSMDFTVPTRFRVKNTASGGSTTVEFAWYQLDASAVFGTTTSLAALPGAPSGWWVEGNPYTDGMAFSHVFAVTDTSLDLTGGYDESRAFNGYPGEPAARRWFRHMNEAGLQSYIDGDVDDSPPMGRQKPATLLNSLKTCVVTDGGLMYDEPLDIALTLRTYREMVRRTPVLALVRDGALGTVKPPLRRAADDQGAANDVTLENADGTKARVVLESGPRSVQPPPDGIGRYKTGSDLPINYLTATRVQWRANWEMRKGTLNRPRYLKVVVDLEAHPTLANTVTGMRPGDWITIEGEEPDLITLRVISIEHTGNATAHTVTFNCLPAEPYQVAIFDDADSRLSSSSTTLASGVAAGVTTLPITTPYRREIWTTKAASIPHPIMVSGERMTVTAVSAASGSGPFTQDLTVTRAENGVSKALAAGARVTAADPKVFGNG